MADEFDPYYKWLGIKPDEHPISHYRLLGIHEFEDDLDVIESAADRQMSHVQNYKLGKHSAESQKLLNELSEAQVCLLNQEKKAQYDQELRKERKSEKPEAVAPPPEVKQPPQRKEAPPTRSEESRRRKATQPDTGSDSTRTKPGRSKNSSMSRIKLAGAAAAGVVILAGVLYWASSGETPAREGNSTTAVPFPAELRNGLVLHYDFDQQEQEQVTDQSGKGNHGKPMGATWKKSTDDARGGVYELDGQDDVISIPPATIGNWEQLTLSVWINAPHIKKPIDQYFPAFIGSYTTNPGVNIGMHLYDWDGGVMGGEVDTDRGNFELTGGTLVVPWGQWFHAVMVYDGTTVTIYLNGEAGGSLPASGKLRTPTALAAGSHHSMYGLLRGTVDDVMIFDRALSEEEITQLYTFQGGR